MDEGRNHFSGRLRRYGNMTTAMGGSAARFLGNHFLGMEINHESQARSLAEALGGLKGPVMKIAQFLSTVPDAVPEEYARAFMALQSQAPPMGWLFVRRRMRAELGEHWEQKFLSFERESCAAASLGQVHKARSVDGNLLACKLQYPDMISTVEADLAQLRLLLKVYENTFGAISVDEIFEEVAMRLREELDYALEARHMKIYAGIFTDDASIHVPFPETTLSTGRLLTMSWLDGKHVDSFVESPAGLRNMMAENLFRAWYFPFYRFGLIHGDPHAGNYTFRDNGEVNLLDFGCIRKFGGEFVSGVINLYSSFLENREDQAVEAYRQWGFTDLSRDMIEVLNMWARMLYEPLLDDRVRPIHPDNRGLEGRAMADRVHRELRRLGGVKPPREFVFMDRACVGIGSIFMRLKAEANWYCLFNELIEGFDSDLINQRQHDLLKKYELNPS